MGSTKALLVVDGESLLQRAVTRLRTVADPIIIAGDISIPLPDDVIVVRDARAAAGPLGGIVAALDASPHELCAVLAVDMPDADAVLLRTLATQWDGDDAVVPVSDTGLEPLHAIYARAALPALRASLAAQRLALHDALATMRVRRVEAAAVHARPGFAGNLNTPADLRAWEERRRANASRRR